MSISWTDSDPSNSDPVHSDPGNRRDPIVFLHAFPLSSGMWEEQVSDLSRDYRVITLDWPGFGKSPLSVLREDGSDADGLTGYAICLLELLDRLDVERAHLCGLSMGGYIALRLFRLAPERIRSLILCDTRATADTPEVKLSRYETARMVREGGAEGIERLASMMVERLLGDSTLASNRGLVDRVTGLIRQNSAEGIARALVGMAERQDSVDLLPLIGGPAGVDTLILVGNEDKLTPLSEMRGLAAAINNSVFLHLEKAGHLPNLEQAETFNRLLREFLR